MVWPEDPLSGGTWIGATDAGLALALLNVDAQRRTDDRLSRGLVIPALADARSLDAVTKVPQDKALSCRPL